MKSSPSCPANLLDCWKHFFSVSKTMPAYLQYGNGLFASWACHTPLTGLLGPYPAPIGHPCDILGWRIHDCIPSQLPHIQILNTSWLINGNVFHEGVGYNHRLLLSMRKRLIECIYKGQVAMIQDMTIYINFIIITCSCLYLLSTVRVNWGGHLFISMSILNREII